MKNKVLSKMLVSLLVAGMCTSMIPGTTYASGEAEVSRQEQTATGEDEKSAEDEGSAVTDDKTSDGSGAGSLEGETSGGAGEDATTDAVEKTEDTDTSAGDTQTPDQETQQKDEDKAKEEEQEVQDKAEQEESEPALQSDEGEAKAATGLPEGTYYISSGKSVRQVLDVADGSKNNSANVQLYGTNVTAAQQWKVTYDKDGYATIQNIGSGKVLDVSGGTVRSGQNVQQYTANGTKAQKWVITQTSDGYMITSVLSKSYVLDCAGGNSSNGTNMQIYASNNSKAQRFQFTLANVAPVSGTQAVENGVYTIYTQAASGKCLDVDNAGTSNGANIQIYGANGTQAQSFQFTYDSKTACYTIVNTLSGLALDADCGNPINGTNVHLWSSNGTNAQKWAITKESDGTLTILNRASGTALDIAGAKTANGTNVQLSASTKSQNQKFTLKKSKVLSDGIYAIATCLNYGKYADVPNASTTAGAQMQLFQGNGSPAQKYVVHSVDGDAYTIGVVASGMYLTGESGKVVQRAESGKDNQKWVLTLNGNGLTIKNKATGTVMDCTGGNSGNGTRLQLYQANGTTAQRFRFFSTPVVNSGLYEISSAVNLNRRVDVANGNSASGTNIQLWDANGTNSQKFWFTAVGTNVYRITNAKTGKALDVKNGSTANGANVQQWDVNGNNAQNWKAVVTDSGWYTFVNVASGKNLDVSGGQNANGANIQSYAGNGTAGQRWHLIPTTKKNTVEDAVADQAKQRAAACGNNLASCFNWSAGMRYYSNDDSVPNGYTPSQWYAKYGFDNGVGDCYVMASTFCHMARQLGYEAYFVQGSVPSRNGNLIPHGWTEVVINGTVYVCDPDFTNETGKNGYMISYGTSGTWRYSNYGRVN